MRKRIIAMLLSAAILIAAVYLAGWLLMPVRQDYGSTWEAFLQEPKDTVDTLFFGSSLVYCDIMPTVMEQETAIRAYVMAGPEQTIPITYYYLRETCRTQSPKTVVVELTGMFFNEYQNYTKVNIGYMPWSLNRLHATFEAAEESERMGLLFPLYQYHDRIYSTSFSEVLQHLNPKKDPDRGYTYLDAAQPQTEVKERAFTADSDAYRKNLDYLQKIAVFCQEQKIALVLYIAPAYSRIPQNALQTLKNDLQTIPHSVFYDCNDGSWQELNAETDWYDSLHYNVHGAKAFSAAFARRLAQDLTA